MNSKNEFLKGTQRVYLRGPSSSMFTKVSIFSALKGSGNIIFRLLFTDLNKTHISCFASSYPKIHGFCGKTTTFGLSIT